MWLFFALLAPAFYGGSNIFDSLLANRKFRNPFALIFYTSLFNLVFIPLVFLFQRPAVPPAETIPIFILLGLVNIGYLYPYYRALQNDDTSVVTAFFGLNRIFIPILAFLVVGEVLSAAQYAGIFLIIAGVTALGLHREHARFRISKATGYMALAAFIMAFEGILLKYLFERGVGVSTALGGEMLVSFFLAMLFLAPAAARTDIAAHLGSFRNTFRIFAAEETLTFLGFVTESYAIAIAPVGLVKGVTVVAPFFILLYAKALKNRFPEAFRENIGRGSVSKKAALFALIVLGVALVRS
ncbi:DMT family transporter [Candidatus Parcubacteria bacterium]|nr:MAG: DMT family transporter [Candidatus Parcubacteria bacterium]